MRGTDRETDEFTGLKLCLADYEMQVSQHQKDITETSR